MSLSETIGLYFHRPEHKIGQILIDAFLRESHEHKAKITEHPIESAFSFIDHVYAESPKISVEGIISNTPMSFLGLPLINSAQNWFNNKSNNRAKEIIGEIEEIFYNKKPITIITSLKVYEDMVLESFSVSLASMDAIRFNFAAKKLVIAKLNHIKIPESKVSRGKPKKALGKQPAKEIPQTDAPKLEEVKKKSSILKSFFN